MNPISPAARWSPRLNPHRPFIGQGGTAPAVADVLTVTVLKDKKPLPGAALDVTFMNGDSKAGVTDKDGKFSLPYTVAQRGQALVMLAQPDGVEDLGEGGPQAADLKGGPVPVTYDLVGLPSATAAGSAPHGAAPYIALGAAALLYGLALEAF